MSQNELIVSSSPHIFSEVTVKSIMRDVLIALLPVILASVYFFGYRALLTITVSAGSCILAQFLFNRFFNKGKTEKNVSAAITGLLFALTLPPEVPYPVIITGAVSGILLGKIIFGGLGQNPFNPALVGRAIIQVSWPVYMTTWKWPQDIPGLVYRYSFDTVSMATPLGILKETGSISSLTQHFLTSGRFYLEAMFLGNRAGAIGESSALAILIGAIFLLYRKHISLHIPLAYILTVVLAYLFTGQDILFHIMAGGLLLGAFFMATDYVTSPYYFVSQIIFGAGCGILTFLIRYKGGFPEGVCFAILIMNMFTPLLNRNVRPRRFGR